MRQVVLDTETTGLSWEKGNRVVEIGCVELIDRRPTKNQYHQYLQPNCEFEIGAQQVTGLTLDFLADKPVFNDVVEEFLAFISGAELIIHNASFDIGFLNNELRLAGYSKKITDYSTVQDTLLLARQRYPGQRNSLDALCKRLGVDNTQRQLHGALLDAQLLSDVYILLTSGQEEIGFFASNTNENIISAPEINTTFQPVISTQPRVQVKPSLEELAAHQQRLEILRKKTSGQCVWDSFDSK